MKELALTKHVCEPLGSDDPAASTEWMRTAYIDSTDNVFVPASLISACEDSVLDRVEVDGVAFMDAGHLYVQVAWACNVYPDRMQSLDYIQQSVRRVHQHKKNIRSRFVKQKYDVQ